MQDIESEDKILGPLSLRQFIYALIMSFFLYLCFISVAKGFPWAMSFLLPPALFTGFLAFPFRRDQPTEVWAVAKFSFLFKPRIRIWDQSGVKDLVTVTVPKRIERIYTNGLSQTEVQSRLSALANTIDSRGWAIKNVNVNLYAQPNAVEDSDRLVAMSSMAQEVPEYTVQASDDMLDEVSSPIAQQFTQMITAKEQAHRQQLIDTLNSPAGSAAPATAESNWFLPRETTVIEPATPFAPTMAEAAVPTAEDIALIEKIKAENELTNQNYNSHLRNVVPLSEQKQPEQHIPLLETVKTPEVVVAAPSPKPSPSTEYLAWNDDRSIESLAREANHTKLGDDQDEVVISLR